jgi:hypothetical protein
MAHTPGPWAVEGESGNDGEAEVIVSDKRTVCWTACSLNEDGEDFNSNEDRANAGLIAAAPDLLAALKEMVAMVEAEYGGFDAVPEWQAATAAINKAEGRGK